MDSYSDSTGVPASEVTRRAIQQYLEKHRGICCRCGKADWMVGSVAEGACCGECF